MSFYKKNSIFGTFRDPWCYCQVTSVTSAGRGLVLTQQSLFLRVFREWVRVSLAMPNPCFKSSEDLQRRHCAELVAP